MTAGGTFNKWDDCRMTAENHGSHDIIKRDKYLWID